MLDRASGPLPLRHRKHSSRKLDTQLQQGSLLDKERVEKVKGPCGSHSHPDEHVAALAAYMSTNSYGTRECQ